MPVRDYDADRGIGIRTGTAVHRLERGVDLIDVESDDAGTEFVSG